MSSQEIHPLRPLNSRRSTQALVFVAALALILPACQRPDIVDQRGEHPGTPEETGVGFELVNGSFRVDGVLRSDRINLSTGRFAFLYVFIKSKGMFIVSADDKAGGLVSGRFAGSRLTIVKGGTRIDLESKAGDMFDDGFERSAWVEYLPGYDLTGTQLGPNDAVVGLAARKDLIPGFEEQGQ